MYFEVPMVNFYCGPPLSFFFFLLNHGDRGDLLPEDGARWARCPGVPGCASCAVRSEIKSSFNEFCLCSEVMSARASFNCCSSSPMRPERTATEAGGCSCFVDTVLLTAVSVVPASNASADLCLRGGGSSSTTISDADRAGTVSVCARAGGN